MVREAEPTDAVTVSTLLVGLGLTSPAEDMAERLRWFRRSGADQVLLAVSGPAVVGLLALTVLPRLTADAPMVRVTTLAVPDGPEQTWVQRALLGEAETVTQRHRCTAIELARPGIAAAPRAGGSASLPAYTGVVSWHALPATWPCPRAVLELDELGKRSSSALSIRGGSDSRTSLPRWVSSTTPRFGRTSSPAWTRDETAQCTRLSNNGAPLAVFSARSSELKPSEAATCPSRHATRSSGGGRPAWPGSNARIRQVHAAVVHTFWGGHEQPLCDGITGDTLHP